MSDECVLAKVIVVPKNSVIKYSEGYNIFYNIETGQTQEGNSYGKQCSWFEELDKKNIMVTEDLMFIKFLHDVSNPKEGYCGTCEMLHEDYSYNEINQDYGNVWNIVKEDFSKFLLERKEVRKSMNYLMMIGIHSTYCSYAGDGDVYMSINDVIKVNGSSFTHNGIVRKDDSEEFAKWYNNEHNIEC
jgi:hypothetical protein